MMMREVQISGTRRTPELVLTRRNIPGTGYRFLPWSGIPWMRKGEAPGPIRHHMVIVPAPG